VSLAVIFFISEMFVILYTNSS